MEKDTNVIEIMPENVSDDIVAALAQGRLCRYTVDLESQLTAEREKGQVYYNVAVEGWGKYWAEQNKVGRLKEEIERLTKEIEWRLSHAGIKRAQEEHNRMMAEKDVEIEKLARSRKTSARLKEAMWLASCCGGGSFRPPATYFSPT